MKHSHEGRALKRSPSISSFTLLFSSLLLYKDSTKLIQSPVKFFFFFFFCGQEILDPTQKLFSSLNLSNTSCLSDELVYPRGGYLANRQMAESVKLVGVLLVIQDAHSQPGEPEARSQWIQKLQLLTLELFLESCRYPISRQRADFASLNPQSNKEEALSEPQGQKRKWLSRQLGQN